MQKKLNSHQFGTGLNLIRVDWSSCISGHTSGDVRHQGADNDFMMTAAHESGHPILASYAYKSTGLSNYSWVHKGSSKGIGSGYQIPQLGEKGWESHPSNKADLMKYYSFGIYPTNYHSVEIDLKSLIWLSLIKIGNLK